MHHICTYFDSNFLPRGLALYESIARNSKGFIFYVLTLDEECQKSLEELGKENIKVISLEEYKTYFKIDMNKYVNKKEFYFSVTPGLCLYVMQEYKGVDILLYLDADVYLFNDLEIVYNEIGDASITMCSHRLPWYISLFSKNYGIYNVGVNAFRNDQEGLKCIEDWFNDCIMWKSGQKGYPLPFFSDQIWLDKWPQKYNNIRIIDHIGINVAPWNAIQYKFSKRDQRYFINNMPLVIYHFSSLKRMSLDMWHGNTSFTIHNISGTLEDIYKIYINNILKYETNINIHTVNLNFEGNKIKMLIHTFLKKLHKHTVNVKKDHD